MANRNRKMVDEEQTTAELEGTLAQALIRIHVLIGLYGADATLENTLIAYDDSGKSYLTVYKKVPETDAKMAYRIAQEEVWEAQATEREKREYARLMDKYGKT